MPAQNSAPPTALKLLPSSRRCASRAIATVVTTPHGDFDLLVPSCAPYEHQFSHMRGGYRRWARAMLTFQATELVWSRFDVPGGRHIRQRRLADPQSAHHRAASSERLRK